LKLAVQDFARGRYAQPVERIRTVREIAHRFGGSHAQRVLLDLTLIEAARRAGKAGLAQALWAERLDRRPATPLSPLLRTRAAPLADAA
jgi:hypothetical protein